ncbi:Leucine-rich repeat containing protein [Entamoeba marina]
MYLLQKYLLFLVILFNASSINLDLLPNVKNVSIQTFCDSSLFDFFTNSNQSFDFVKIRMIGRVDIEFLSNLHMFNFGKCILQLSNQNLVKEVSNIENIFNYAIVVSDEWFDGIDDHVFILNEHEMKLHQSKDIDKLFLDLYFPSVIEFTGENTTPIDLTMFTQLQAINYSTTASFTPPTTLTILHDTFYLNIYDFPELKRLSLMTCNDIVDVPSTVTSLFCFYGDCQLNNLSCLKEISVGDVSVNFVDCISATRIDVLSLTTIQSSFSSLNQLLELCIPNATIPFPNTFYPTSLQSLFCSFSSLPQSLQITQLQLFVNDPVIVDLSQFIHLKDITFFTLYASSLTLPSSILNLSFQYESGPDLYSLDVSKYTTLTQIAFYGYQNKCTVSLPLNLSSLILDSSPQIIIPQLSLLSLCSLSISNQSFDFSKVTPTLKHFYFENHKIIHPHVYEQFNYLHLV